MDHLERAIDYIQVAENTEDVQRAQDFAQTAIAHALIALVKRLTFGGPQRPVSYDWSKARVDREDYAHAMDEAAERIGQRVRACPHCSAEECSH
jgi:hypothetical protein